MHHGTRDTDHETRTTEQDHTTGERIESPVRLRAVVRGRVQGVGFRYFTQREATALGLTGYVRNQWDGTVEVVAEGPRQALERLIARLHIGPRSAYVRGVDVEWGEATGEFRYFHVRF